MSDPRFKYSDIKPPAIPVELLDSLAQSIFDPNAVKLGIVGMVVTGLKLALAVAYLVARDRLIAVGREIEKQEYERAQAGGNQSDIDHDDLAGEHR